MAMTPDQAKEYLRQIRSNNSTSMTPDQAKEYLRQIRSNPSKQTSEQQSAISKSVDENLRQMLGAYSLYSGSKKGIYDFLSGAGKYGAKGIDTLFGTNLKAKVPEYNQSASEQYASSMYPKTYKVGEFIGGTIPMAAVPFGELKIASQAIKSAPEAMQSALRFLGKTGKSAAVNAAIAPIYSPNEDALKSMGYGALVGSAFPIAEKAVGYGLGLGEQAYNKLFKELMGGTASKEQIANNIRAMKNIGVEDKMPIGHVIDSPHSKSASSIMAYIPGSAQARDMMDIGKSIENKVTGVMDEIKPNKEKSLSEISLGFIDDLKKGEKFEKNISDQKYKKLEDKAKSAGVNFNKDKLYDTRYSVSKEISGTDLENDKILNKFLDKIEETESSPIYGTRKKKTSTFNDALSLRKDINQSIRDTPFDQKQKRRHLMNIKDSLDYDLKNSANYSGNQEVIGLLNDANKHYIEKVIPITSNEISKFTKMGADPDTFIQTFMKTGKYDRDNLLDKVANYLTEENKGKFAHTYLNKSSKNILGSEETNNGKILNEYMKMPENAKKKLFSPSQREIMDSAYTVRKIAGGDLNQLVNPKTGNVWAKIAGIAGSASIAPPIVANIAVRLLRSPELREKYITALTSGKIEGKDIDLSNLNKLLIPYLMYNKEQYDAK